MSAGSWPPLEVRADQARLSFDGRLVTVTRMDRLRRPRSIRQYALSEFVDLRLSYHGNDATQVLLLDINRGLQTVDRLTITDPIHSAGPADAVVHTINEARVQRVRAVLERTVGPGPWPVATWDQIRSLLMLQGYTEPWPPGSGTPDGSRAVYEPGESALLHAFARALTYLTPGNRHGHPPGTPTFPEVGGATTPVELLRLTGGGEFGRVWNGIITALEGDYPVTADPAWDLTVADLLRWGNDQVERRRAGRPRAQSLPGRPSRVVDG
jgi:hypothetical protein